MASSDAFPPPPRTRPPPKTSSERGRTFRERQRQREAALTTSIETLREHILSLKRSRLLRLEALVRRRHAPENYAMRTIREFFTMFQDGLEEAAASGTANHQIQFKENYLRYVYDPDAIVADMHGVDAAIRQWRLYTVFHGSFRVDMGPIDVLGDPEHPTYLLHATLTVRISRATFQHLFPHMLADEVLVQRFLHRLVSYDSVIRLRFNDDGRIDYYGVSVDFVDGLVRAGGTVDEVAQMLEHAQITRDCTFREVDRPDPVVLRLEAPPSMDTLELSASNVDLEERKHEVPRLEAPATDSEPLESVIKLEDREEDDLDNQQT